MRVIARVFLSGLVLCSLSYSQGLSREIPGKKWHQYKTPEEAGFSSAKLKLAQKQFDESDAAGVMIVHNGSALASWGETARRFRCCKQL